MLVLFNEYNIMLEKQAYFLIYQFLCLFFRPSNSHSAQNSYSQRLVQKENAVRRNSLPKTLNKSAPGSSVRLTIFGTSDIVNNLNEADVSDSLSGIPVRLIATKDLCDFREKIEMVRRIVNCQFLVYYQVCLWQ